MKQRKRRLPGRAALVGLFLLVGLLTGCGGPSRVTKETKETTYGVDVARYQATINWQELAQSGMDFAMVRLGYRGSSDGVIKEDSNARYNLQEGSKAGIQLGAYFFSTAISVEEAEEEARWAAKLLANYPITYPVVYDCEGFREPDSRQYGMTKEQRTDAALAFLKTIEKLGYEGMFYASKNELESHWDTERIEKRYKIWVAQYPEAPYPATPQSSYAGDHHMWQYTKSGTAAGITQDVDLNVAYFGYDGIEPAKDPTPPEEVGPDVEAMMHFTQANEPVTAKVETNLRSIPSQDTDSQVLYTLQNGEVAQRIAISDSGWSKLTFGGETYYAVSSYLTTDLGYDPDAPGDEDGIQTQFTPVNEPVTAKVEVNLRSMPSVDHPDCQIIASIKNGEVVTRTGINEDVGWSRVEYNGQTCYAVSNYLTGAGDSVSQSAPTQPEGSQEGSATIKTQFTPVSEPVTAKVEVNLRTMPSVDHPDCQVIASIKNGEVVTRTGINEDVGWSRVEYNGQTLYCVSSYLTAAE